MSPQVVGTLLCIVAAVGFGSLAIMSRRAAELGLGAVGFVTWRATLGALALGSGLSVAAAAGRTLRPSGAVPVRARAALVSAALCSLALNIAMFIAFERTSIALALIAFYVYPAIVAVLQWRLYGERLDAVRIGALLLASGGLLLVALAPAISSGGLVLDPFGLALALGAACLQACFALLSARGYPMVPAPRRRRTRSPSGPDGPARGRRNRRSLHDGDYHRAEGMIVGKDTA